MALVSSQSIERVAARVGILSHCTSPLSRLSVCKKIGLGYVPAVGFMLVVALVSLFVLRSAGAHGGVTEPLPLLIIIGTLVTGIASVTAMLTAFSVGERVRTVLGAAEAAAHGDLGQQVPARPDGDEVDRLAASFNTMTVQLRQRIDYEQMAREQAEQASAAKSQFLSTMSHELRTPLTTILGFSELLEELAAGKLSADEERYLHRMREAGQHLLSVVNDALDMSRVEAGRVSVEPVSIPLDELLESVVESIRPLSVERDQRLEANLPREHVTVNVDPLRIRQVLYNLLSNAVKFTPTGGSVELRASVIGHDLLLEVEDTGIGIPADRHDRVFGLFERLHDRRYEASGTGLGLALTKRLVELHHGEIDFRSAAGAGTCFRVRLPGTVSAVGGIEPDEGEQRLAALLDAIEAQQRAEHALDVLLVDDDRINARLFADMLEADGHRVAIEHDGRAGERRASSERFDVLLLDIRMPELRGDDLCRLLRSRGLTVPVIALSANAMPADINEGLSAGFDAYLTKPIAPATLRSAVREVVERQRHNATPVAAT